MRFRPFLMMSLLFHSTFSLPVRHLALRRAFNSTKSARYLSTSSTHYPNAQSFVSKPKVIFVLGGPGSGKGTQCERLSTEFGIRHLSAGELLRQEILSASENGKLIDEFLKLGKIVPVDISLGLLRTAIESKPYNRYLIDGFPRNWDNLQGWNILMTDVCDLEMVLCIDCNEAELERRILDRGITSGRSDDNPETARRRFRTFQAETMPVVEHFKQQEDSKLVYVNGAQHIDKVYHDITEALVPKIQQEIVDITRQYKSAQVSEDGALETKQVDIESADVQVEGKVATIRCRVKGEFVSDILKWKLVNGQWQRIAVL